MQQSNFIFGALAVAFVVFITTRGSLPVYMSVLFGTAAAPGAGPAGASSGKSEYSPAGQAVRDIAGKAVTGAIGGLFQ